jgi:hypothetical protein
LITTISNNFKFQSIIAFFSKRYMLLLLTVTAIAVVVVQKITLHSANNFFIFKASLGHLLAHKNLYLYYANEYEDLFLYNPTFVVLFAPFALLPSKIGMVAWLTTVGLGYYFAFTQLTLFKHKGVAVFLFCFIEMITTLQGLQLNALNAVLMLLAYQYMKDQKPYLAGFITAFVFFVKIYPAAIGIVLLLLPQRNKYLLSCVVSSILFAVLPLVFISFEDLVVVYQQWFAVLTHDTGADNASQGISLVAILYKWFNNSPPISPAILQLVGLAITLLPLIKIKQWASTQFQLLLLASVMMLVIVFNHAAESPTYIIAVMGVCVWYCTVEATIVNKLLMLLVFLFCILLPTDIYPKAWRVAYFVPYSIKTLPVVLVWLKLQIDIFSLKPSNVN